MDVLSDAVAAMRTGVPHSSRTRLHAPWGLRFAPLQGAGFHVVLQGSCWLLPTAGEPIRLGVGDVAFLPRELGHAIADDPTTPLVDSPAGQPAGPGEPGAPLRAPDAWAAGVDGAGQGATTVLLCGAYRLDQSRAHPLLAELPDVVHLPARVGQQPALRGAIELLGRELAAEPLPGAVGALSALLDVLLLYILRAWHEEQAGHSVTGWGAALRDPAVAAALRAVHREPARPWTVQTLAAEAGLSRSAFAQRFTGTVGSPPLAYLTWWRMTFAARLLRETDAVLRSVAERSGYTSEYAFAKAFKREFGTAPGRYRAAARPARQS
ncbi:AraC family transcriptional regulator [Peterkaempfera griseoplana]|uniref:AraC family transcriptional regulator n=1 Tax=Peterkaempfera griseoplana TaxID=66896 RepID=UPI0006E3331F|nr:AraC family transcriptional regulator [Peterkaempfera griseoplana]